MLKRRGWCQLYISAVFIIGFFKYLMPALFDFTTEQETYSYRRAKTIRYLSEISSTLPVSPNDFPTPVALFPTINTIICLITKNGNSVLRYSSCLLKIAANGNETAYEIFNQHKTHRGAFTAECNKLLSHGWDFTKAYKTVAFIREPLERFISAYLFVCKRDRACFDCGSDFFCFMTTLYNCWRTRKQFSPICNYDYSSATNTDSSHNFSSYIYWHLMPQAAFCNLSERHDQYELLQYSQNSMRTFLMTASQNVLDEVQNADFDKRLRQKTEHSAAKDDANMLKKLIMSHKLLARMFAELYFIDYKTFSIELPKFIVDFELFRQ